MCDPRLRTLLTSTRLQTLIDEVKRLYNTTEIVYELREDLDNHGAFDPDSDPPRVLLNSGTGLTESNIAHELVHAAVLAAPEILDRWMAIDKPWWMRLVVGFWYPTSHYRREYPELSEEAIDRQMEEEFLAMTVSGLQYDDFFGEGD